MVKYEKWVSVTPTTRKPRFQDKTEEQPTDVHPSEKEERRPSSRKVKRPKRQTEPEPTAEGQRCKCGSQIALVLYPTGWICITCILAMRARQVRRTWWKFWRRK